MTGAANTGSHRDYVRWRSRQIAYGRWQPWADAAEVRAHLQMLRQAGGSDRAIARAAGVSPMTVHRIQPSADRAAAVRVRAALVGRLLAVTPAVLESVALRRDASGSRRRLRALVALGHPGASLARYLGVPPATVWNLLRGTTVTISAELETAIRSMYEQIWDLRPPERTAAESRAAAAARTRAAQRGWPTPMALDDDRIDDPAYRPRSRWLPASGTGLMPAHAGRAAAPISGNRTGTHRPGPDAWRVPVIAAANGSRDEQ